MLGAYFLVALWQGLKLNYFAAIVLALLIMAVFGLVFELTIYYPLRNRSFLPVIIATIGASIMMQNGALAVFGPSPEKLRPIVDTVGGTGGITLAGVFFDYQYLIILVVTAAARRPPVSLLRVHHPGQEDAGHLAGQGHGQAPRHPGGVHDRPHLHLQQPLGRPERHARGPDLLRDAQDGGDAGSQGLRGHHLRRVGDVRAPSWAASRWAWSRASAPHTSRPSTRTAISFLVLMMFLLLRPQGIFGEKVSEKA